MRDLRRVDKTAALLVDESALLMVDVMAES